jgi:hypothetical protein
VRRACGRGARCYPRKKTRTTEGATRVVEPRDSDDVRSLVGYDVLLCFLLPLFFVTFFLFFTFFFMHKEGTRSLHRVSQATRRGGRFGLRKKTTPVGANSVARGFSA